MFVGHYAAAFAIKAIEPKTRLASLFLAVQFVDLLFFPLVLLGVEKMRIVPHFTDATHFSLDFMPYTHSLVAALFWAALWGLAYHFFGAHNAKTYRRISLLMMLAVFSHWLLDYFTHTPDLPLFSDHGSKVGLGLWENAIATYAVEATLLISACIAYYWRTSPTGTKGHWPAATFVVTLLVISAGNTFGPAPQPDDLIFFALLSTSTFLFFAAIASIVDRYRQ